MGSACRQGYVLLPRKPKTDGDEQCSRSQVGIAGNIARSAVWLAHSAVESVAAPKARSKRIGRFGRLVRASGSGSTSASVRQRPNSQLLPRVPRVHGRAKQLLDEIDHFRVESLSQLPVWRREGAVGENLFKDNARIPACRAVRPAPSTCGLAGSPERANPPWWPV